MLQQPAVARDRVALQEALEVPRLELELLVLRVRQRVLAADGVEQAQGAPSFRVRTEREGRGRKVCGVGPRPTNASDHDTRPGRVHGERQNDYFFFGSLYERSTVSLGSVETGWSRHSQRIISGSSGPPI